MNLRQNLQYVFKTRLNPFNRRMVGNAIRAIAIEIDRVKKKGRAKAKGRNEEEINAEQCVNSNILII